MQEEGEVQFLLPWMEHDLGLWERKVVDPRAASAAPTSAFLDLTRESVAQEAPGEPEKDGPFSRVASSILGYRIFGPRVGMPVIRREPVEEGDTLGLRYAIFPGLDLFFASRVVEVFEKRQREDSVIESGFRYRTLVGHPELGEEVFRVEKEPVSGQIHLHIEAWSLPNLWLVRLLRPWARHIQRSAATQAHHYLSLVASTSHR